MPKRARGVLAVAFVVVLVASACSSDSDKDKKKEKKATTTTAAKSDARPSGLPDVKQDFKATGPLEASAPGVTEDTIKIGYITSETGIAASTFKGGALGAKARVELQNAQGGINGRQIELFSADDGGPNGNKGAAQDLVENKGVFAIVDFSPFVVLGGFQYLQEQGIPVTGSAFDGPEWGQEPNSNMFTTDLPPVFTKFPDDTYYFYDDAVKFLKAKGVKKLAGVGFGISPSSSQQIKATMAAAANHGIENCYENIAVAFGQTSFTTEALAIKNAGCDGVLAAMVDASNVGLGAALQQAGHQLTQLYLTGYDQAVIDDENAVAALEGAHFVAHPNFTKPNAATKGMLAALEEYAPELSGQPTFGVWGSYRAMDVMIKGLEVAGENPTRESFIENMRNVDSYEGRGLFNPPLKFTGFGTKDMFPSQQCTSYAVLTDGEFEIDPDGERICGELFSYK